MKAEDLKTKTIDELSKLLLEKRKEQMNLRFQRGGGQLENTSAIRKTRRTIARIKTFIAQQNAGAVAKPAKKETPAKKKAAAKKPAAKKTTKKKEEAAA